MSNTCSKHKTNINGYDSIQQLAEDISNLRYDSLVEFLSCLRIKLRADGMRDQRAGKPELANSLIKASEFIAPVRGQIENAWKISKPYMEINE